MSEDAVRDALDRGGEVVDLPPLLDTFEGACPIRALGFSEGPAFYFLDAAGQISRLTSRAFTSSGILALFLGDDTWLADNFKLDKNRRDGKPDWELSRASGVLMRACRQAGPFRPERDVRGPGVWPDSDEEDPDAAFDADGAGLPAPIIVHLGRRLLRISYAAGPDGAPQPRVVSEAAGRRHGRWVYPAFPDEPGPDLDGAAPTPQDAQVVLDVLGTCSWRNPDIDARLLLGAIGIGLVVGIAPYRPPVWLVAPSKTGKSAVIRILCRIFDGAEQHWVDTTAPKIRDTLAAAARPVIVDEFEAKEQSQRERDIVEFSRNSYESRGGQYGRSGNDSKSGRIYASFFFASVDPPPVLPQDENRRAVLEMVPVRRDAQAKIDFETSLRQLRGVGGRLRRRILAHWGRFDATFLAYRTALFGVGHDTRGADTYGVLLAVADLLTADATPDAKAAATWAEHLDAQALALKVDASSSAEECWAHLAGSMIEKWEGGDRVTVGRLLGEVLFQNQIDARKALARRGIAVRYFDGEACVCVANPIHPSTRDVFKGSRWYSGGWQTALRSPPIDGRPSENAVKFDGIPARATIIPAKDLVQHPDAAEEEATKSYADEQRRKREAEAAQKNKVYVPGPGEDGGPEF